jgi:hypothetical protein
VSFEEAPGIELFDPAAKCVLVLLRAAGRIGLN